MDGLRLYKILINVCVLPLAGQSSSPLDSVWLYLFLGEGCVTGVRDYNGLVSFALTVD